MIWKLKGNNLKLGRVKGTRCGIPWEMRIPVVMTMAMNRAHKMILKMHGCINEKKTDLPQRKQKLETDMKFFNHFSSLNITKCSGRISKV